MANFSQPNQRRQQVGVQFKRVFKMGCRCIHVTLSEIDVSHESMVAGFVAVD